MTAIEPTAATKYPLALLVQKRAEQVTPFLPKGVTIEMIGQIVQMMAIKQPELLLCTPNSLITAITRGLRAGLEIGEEWHLLPFKSRELSDKYKKDVYEVTGVADYKAIAQLMVDSGAVRYVDPQVVREGDEFSYRLGLDKTLAHLPGVKQGKITGAYVILRLPFGVSDFLYMDIGQIDAIRLAKSKSWKNGPCPDWYAKKTVIKQIAKLMPKGRRMKAAMQAVEQDEASELEDVQEAEVVTEERPPNVGPNGEDLTEWPGYGEVADPQ